MHDSSLTPATLSRWLRDWGTLPYGAIADINIELKTETTISTLVFLTAKYSPDAPANLPRRIVVKSPLSRSLVRDDSGAEAQFYCRLASILGTPPLVRCLAALEDGDGDAGTVVLEDIRATHDHPPWPLPPSRSQCENALDALACVHAQWWEAPTLGITIGQLHTPEGLTTMVEGIAAKLSAFIDALGDRLTTEGRHTYERVFRSSLRPWLRLTDPRALTIIHGDAHTWNFLFPRSGTGPAYLIDWHLWHIDLGVRDIAFFMALHWYPTRRRDLERVLIKYYYDRLLVHGMENYSFDELWLDYRRCVVRNLTIPIIFWSRGMNPEGWWHRLECALAAYRDLACDELL
jgi:Phosphotransferase enzyme family